MLLDNPFSVLDSNKTLNRYHPIEISGIDLINKSYCHGCKNFKFYIFEDYPYGYCEIIKARDGSKLYTVDGPGSSILKMCSHRQEISNAE